jgi:glucose uptake protein GlcU
MLTVFSFFLTAVILISMVLAIFYSYRYRSQTDAIKRGAFAAKMNISMGFMLVFMAILQIFMFEANTMRTILGIVFLLMGLFNFFSGVRNHMYYKSHKK